MKKRSEQIADVTNRRYMPPWLPEPGYGDFASVRRLTEDELGVIQQWVAEGAAEGTAADAPPTLRWPEGWQLGEPDLVVKMPQRWLLLIKSWDFNWQGDYRYAKPVFLPKGTKVAMRFTYDNSTNNVRNPNQPPKRIRYGLRTTDEMAELVYQVLPRNTEDLAG